MSSDECFLGSINVSLIIPLTGLSSSEDYLERLRWFALSEDLETTRLDVNRFNSLPLRGPIRPINSMITPQLIAINNETKLSDVNSKSSSFLTSHLSTSAYALKRHNQFKLRSSGSSNIPRYLTITNPCVKEENGLVNAVTAGKLSHCLRDR